MFDKTVRRGLRGPPGVSCSRYRRRVFFDAVLFEPVQGILETGDAGMLRVEGKTLLCAEKVLLCLPLFCTAGSGW